MPLTEKIIVTEILSKIKPNQEEQSQFKAAVSAFLIKLNSQLKNAQAILGGSGAKDTWLSGNHDVDIFVLFDYKLYADKSEQLSSILEPTLKKAFPKLKLERLHGSRDYFQLIFQQLSFEVVPILAITKAKQALNITDVSHLHSQWVNKQGKTVKDEIRLAKQFCKANNLYGAESYIGGFSGYVLEILTIYYGAFNALLAAAQKWGMKEIIDPSKFYSGKEALFNINKSKLQSPLIVIDPVDQSRNAAAALSTDKFIQFKKLAKAYLKKPELKFFEKKPITLVSLRKEAGDLADNLIYLEAVPVKGKIDVVGMKLLKVFNYLETELKPFVIRKSGWDWDADKEARMYFILAKKELPKFEIRSGPPLKMKEFVSNFKKKNKNTFEEKGRIMAKVKVEHNNLSDFVNHLLSSKYAQERVKRITVIK